MCSYSTGPSWYHAKSVVATKYPQPIMHLDWVPGGPRCFACRDRYTPPFSPQCLCDTPPLKIPLISIWRCTEAIQSFISHFNQYGLVDPSWGNIPSWVWQGVSNWFKTLWHWVWHHRHCGNWISWKKYFSFPPRQAQMQLKNNFYNKCNLSTHTH